VRIRKHIKNSLRLATVFILPLSMLFAGTASASGSAYFSLSPSSGSYKTGSTITLTVKETSSGSDNTNAVQANLSYSSSLLKYVSTGLGPFSLCAQNSGGSGSVHVGCAATSTESGTQTVATIKFTVQAKGTATVSMASGSDIDNTSGASVWNGSLPKATFTLTSSSSSSSSSGSTSSYTPPTSSSTTTKPKTTTKTPTQTKPTTTTPSTVVPPTATLDITVTDSNGKPIKNAKVVVDNNYTKYSDAQGKVSYTSLKPGEHSVVVTANGKQLSQVTIPLSANQTEPLAFKLTSTSSSAPKVTATIMILAAFLGGAAFWYFKIFRKPFGGASMPVADVVVNGQQFGPPQKKDPNLTALAQRLAKLDSPSQQVPQQSTPGRTDTTRPSSRF
jgi:hypothetical protein